MFRLFDSLKTFPKGGVHPPENKFSAGAAIEELPLPKMVHIPISQHIGAPSEPVVERGDEVKVGQIIAKSAGFVSANIHSSVSGKVAKIQNMIDSSGFVRTVISVRVKGDEWEESIDRSPDLVKEIAIEAKDIIQKTLENGIVGLGGAAFPSHVKLSVPRGKKAEYLILNGVECEPYLTADHRLMLEKADEILVGAQILMKALDVKKCIVGIENNKSDAIEVMKKTAANYEGVEVQALKVQYPQGGEKQLIKAVINREVPSGGLPIDVGAVVHNVGTTYAVYQAVQKNKPLLERVVTITGKSVSKPSNFMVRIGTPINELIEAAGGLPEDTGKIISGGPMMGKALTSTDIPVAKATSGVLIIPENESRRGVVEACIRCSKCVGVCPMGLEPYLLMTQGEKAMFEQTEQDRVMDCIECGSCVYECPSNRPLLDWIRLSKVKVNTIRKERAKN